MFNQGNYSLSDIAAVTDGERYNGWGNNGAWWIIILFLFMFMGWGGNGFGRNTEFQGALTRSDMFEGFNNQDINSQLRGITTGLCDGFYAMNTGMLNGFNGIQRDLCVGFNGITAGINESRFDAQQCCCETNRNIDAVRYENSKNTCDIVNAIREDGNATRALINANVMQDLRDKINDKDRELQSAQFQISQQAQNQYLVNQIKPCAIPAYITCSPYESALIGSRYGYGYGYGCGCGCN